MWGKLIFNSFRRDRKRKAVAIFAVALATCLATFLLHWSLNLGDRIQKDLRAYGSNIVIVPQGQSVRAEESSFASSPSGFLKLSDMQKIHDIFWRNQIVGMAPVLATEVLTQGKSVQLLGTEFGSTDPVRDLRKVSPYLKLQGKWPADDSEVISGEMLARERGWKSGDEITVSFGAKETLLRISGIVSSGGDEEKQLIGRIGMVSALMNRTGTFNKLLVSAMTTPANRLYEKYQRDPGSLTPQEQERYFCTPFVSTVALDVAKALKGGEPRIIRQVSQTEEKIVKKVNWLMVLVTLAGLIASSLTMTSTTTAMILERRKELALMKALGSNNGFLIFYLFSEILILGCIGSLLGYLAGSILSVGLSSTVFESAIEMKWIVLPLVSIIGILIIFCGSIWPLRQAVRLEPAHALKDL